MEKNKKAFSVSVPVSVSLSVLVPVSVSVPVPVSVPVLLCWVEQRLSGLLLCVLADRSQITSDGDQ